MNQRAINIILAEDDESDRINFRDALEGLKVKINVHTVNDGIELMEYLLKEETPLPYLLFLDLNMPRKGGIECLKEIRGSEKLQSIIVAIYSTSISEKDIEDTFVNGANVYIKKPNDFRTLKQSLAKVVAAAHVYSEPPFNVANFLFKL